MTPHSMCRCMHNCQKKHYTATKIHRYKQFKKTCEYSSHTIINSKHNPFLELDKKKTHGFLREAQPAWTSNCEGLICITFNKWNLKVLSIQIRNYWAVPTKIQDKKICLSVAASTDNSIACFDTLKQFLPTRMKQLTGQQNFHKEIHAWTTCPRA